MKKTTFILSLLVAMATYSCKHINAEDVPEKVRGAFAERFPNVKEVAWAKENSTEFEAEFKENGIEYSANFDANGFWQETEHKLDPSELPMRIRLILDQNFDDYDLERVEISETPTGYYHEMEVEENGNEWEVRIDEQGNMTKQSEED